MIYPDNSISPTRSILSLFGWVVFCFLASVTAAIWPPGEWYLGLAKPTWNPPNWLFGPVWSTLYLVMGFSAWRVWRLGGFAGAGGALRLFLTQLAINAAWTPVFFGLHWTGLGLLVLAALWLAVGMTIIAFLHHDELAAAMLVPYFVWVSFAVGLNFAIWRLN